LPFDLHPEYPAEGIPRAQLHARYGEGLHDRLRESFRRAGLEYAPPPDVVPNSRTALRVTELARNRGLHEPVHERLMDAYWAEGRNIGDLEVLRPLVVEAGLDEAEVDEVLAGDGYLDDVDASTGRAVAIGVTGVPGWVLDGRLLVFGAQPREVFESALERLGIAPVADA
jgi:predicted DsbA family dithiol-disulfide isomerase